MTTKQVRWRCPSCHSGVLAPSRPRKLDVRRWCLECSAKGPKLVERVPVALEAKRKERKKQRAKKAREKRGFKRPRDYYAIGTAADVRTNLVVVPNSAVRVRQTKGPGPIKIVQNDVDSIVIFRKGPWLDRFDFAAQVYAADARWSLEVISAIVGRAKPASRLRRLGDLRDKIKERMSLKQSNAPHPLAGWRPLGISTLETSLADHLRKNAAVKLLQDTSDLMERTA